MRAILIIDDDIDMCGLLGRYLERKGFEVRSAYSGSKGIAAFKEKSADIVLCDFRLGGEKDGKDVLRELKAIDPAVAVIIITAYSDIKMAVEVMRLGAYDYVTKPLIPDEILNLINKALGGGSVTASGENINASKKANQPDKKKDIGDEFISGVSSIADELAREVSLVAPTAYSVIIYGESGTGKEVIARTIHKNSARSNKPFVTVDCGTLSRELAASELFGHQKGSFTGAIADKEGLFEMADGGTLFLDEIANLPADVQTTLLRVMQERKFKRVGSTADISVDVRVIVASNENLTDACSRGKFREDLYHRFNEFSIHVPPLRNRKEDIPIFADFFLKKVCAELNKDIEGFDEEVQQLFMNYGWPGNLREFRNVIRRAGLLHAGGKITANVLPWEILGGYPTTGATAATIVEMPPTINASLAEIKTSASVAEYHAIMNVLKKVRFNKTKAAAMLNIDRKTLYNKIKAYEEHNKVE